MVKALERCELTTWAQNPFPVRNVSVFGSMGEHMFEDQEENLYLMIVCIYSYNFQCPAHDTDDFYNLQSGNSTISTIVVLVSVLVLALVLISTSTDTSSPSTSRVL